jgi:hypothetical protein
LPLAIQFAGAVQPTFVQLADRFRSRHPVTAGSPRYA